MAVGTKILNGKEASHILAGFNRVAYAAVAFCGEPPEGWAALAYEKGNWAAISSGTAKALTEELRTAIQKGTADNVWLSFEPWGEDCALNADFENGWAALLYSSASECAASLYRPDRPDGAEDAPVNIGGQTPVPKMCALEDMGQAAEAVCYFLENGRFHPDMQWAVLVGSDLPWTEAQKP